jgi:hypothetical protein
MVAITSLYAGVLALIFVVLSVLVIRARGAHKVSLGTANVAVERAVRAHGNFAEYVPFALLLMAIGELDGLPAWAMHMLGVLLLAGRLTHAFGISREPEDFRFRVAGMAMTFTTIGLAALALLGLAAAAL